MSFIDEVEEAEAKARMRRAAPVAALGIAALVLAVSFFALQGLFSGGQFVVEAASSSAAAAESGSGVDSGSSAGGNASGSGSAAAEGAGDVCVYVTGAVNRPGVYTLGGTARVNDAIKKAGGFTSKADRAALNLARVLVDGEQIEVMTKSQIKAARSGAGRTGNSGGASAATSRSASAVSGSAAAAGGTVAASGKVNINTAGLEELKTLDGIGDVTAQKIIDYRDASGPFAKPSDLKNVSGIGDKKYAAVADRICV